MRPRTHLVAVKVLAKTIARYGRVDLLRIDELGYMELDKRGAELLFQVLTERITTRDGGWPGQPGMPALPVIRRE